VLGVAEIKLKNLIIMLGPKPIKVMRQPVVIDQTKIPYNCGQNMICSELSNMTRSGRVYKPSHLILDYKPEESKNQEQLENQPKKDSTGYDVISQLKKTKAEIFVWELLLKSPTHYQALQRVLQTINVPTCAEPKDIERLIGQIPDSTHGITFSDNEVPPEKKIIIGLCI
jgi:hypothetical protein